MKLIYRKHAIMRMFERNISDSDIREILSTGGIIARYPDDTPYPSQLILGWIDNKPVHILTAEPLSSPPITRNLRLGLTTSRGSAHEMPYLQTRRYN
ncbi:MAG: DUF4258 domain-containing protein [Methylobacter sp.]